MDWPQILVICLAVPVLLIPLVLIWYINTAGIISVLKNARERKNARHTAAKIDTDVGDPGAK